MDKYGYIYKITNDVNDKVYIGQTVQEPEGRFQYHLRDKRSKDKFHTAIKEIGKDHFYLETLEYIKRTDMDDREKYWIQYYNSYQNGYNSTPGGKGYPVGWYQHIKIIENGLVFESKEELARIISTRFDLDVSYIRSLIKKGRLFNFNIEKTDDVELSSKSDIDTWIETLSYNQCLKGIKCLELNKEFVSITEAAKYFIENGYYTGNSKGNIVQSVVTSISKNLLKKTDHVSTLNDFTFTYTNVFRKQNPLIFNQIPFNKKDIRCIELNITFSSITEAAKYLVETRWKEISIKTARCRISDVLKDYIEDYKNLHFEYI